MDHEPVTPRVRLLSVNLPPAVLSASKLIVSAIVIAGLYFGKALLVPLVLAALLGFVLDPLVARLRRWHLPRLLAVVLVTAFALAAVGASAVLVANQVSQFGKQLPTYQTTIEKKLRELRSRVTASRDGALPSASRVIETVEAEVDATRKALDANSPTKAAPAQRVQVVATESAPLKSLQSLVMPFVEPLLTGGIAIVLLVFILLEKRDLSDRLLRFVGGGDLHQTTDALSEAARRVSRYLSMQVLVNAGYGVPLALGLWAIGVPGAFLWGALGGALRFVPYLGPIVASAFPLLIAFAVDPGWQMMIWTLVLIVTLELISNNVVEPWVYGNTTGLTPVAVLLSAAFWTVLWGPVGLIIATPLTVCLVVLGRHLPQLQFLDLLLGSQPVFDPPTQLYQRLLAGNVEEAVELAETQMASESLAAFYSDTAVPALGRAAGDHAKVATVEQRHRLTAGMRALLAELRTDHPVLTTPPPVVLCIGLRWEADALAADMIAHALGVDGVCAQALPANAVSAEHIAQLDLARVRGVCLSSFHPQPEALVRHVARRLRRMRPELHITVALWQAPPGLLEPGAAESLGADAVAASLLEAVQRTQAALGTAPSTAADDDADDAGPPADGNPTAEAKKAFRRWGQARAAAGAQAAQRAAETFVTAHGVVRWIDDRQQHWSSLDAHDGEAHEMAALPAACLAPVLDEGRTLVIPDLARDAGAGNCADLLEAQTELRFLAAVPLHGAGGVVLGALCLLDVKPRQLPEPEARLLESLGREFIAQLEGSAGASDAADAASEAAAAATSGGPSAPLAGAAAA
ncbi:MAG: AI-2E family transporter [Rubrivivax sp.]